MRPTLSREPSSNPTLSDPPAAPTHFLFFCFSVKKTHTILLVAADEPVAKRYYHVTTADGQIITTAKLILCPGAWGNDLLAHFDLELDMKVCTSRSDRSIFVKRREASAFPHGECLGTRIYGGSTVHGYLSEWRGRAVKNETQHFFSFSNTCWSIVMVHLALVLDSNASHQKGGTRTCRNYRYDIIELL